jgi:hypothetical protein
MQHIKLYRKFVNLSNGRDSPSTIIWKSHSQESST